ncbi:tetratricopeptide repeat protein 14 isoform X1 [Osmerus eperlanus]|uniref:tetratricopeptide repeat protein 14 isoform X1 n=1 Tax=Osmerus eperlanus TaxID=29151 RepID=UPI002E124EF3
MDRDLLRQSLAYHGQSLYAHLSCEQSENPDFKDVAPDLSKVSYERKDGGVGSHMVEQFIARKADILFAPSWRSAAPVEVELDEEAEEPYAIMPPLELFMEVSYEDRRNMFYRDVERGDAVIGRINNIRDFGFFLTLICMGGGLERDIEDLELSALCPTRDVPSNGNHDDPLSYYQIGDLIRAGVKDIDRYHEKVTISLQPSSLSCSLSRLKLGVISRDDLPLHYTRSLRVANDSTETYERVMRSSLGYSNPSIVQFLLGKVGVSDTRPPSVMRGLQSKHFLEEDFAISLRKKQSSSWALKCVRSGVDHFKHNRHVEAMNEYNKALEIDTNNTEALVARGALYANKGSLVKAISDFELALESCPTHRNAKKYLCQTLVERGGQLEEQEKLVTAEGLYRRALALDSTFPDAQEAMTKIQLLIQKSMKLREEAAAKELEDAKNTTESSAQKLRKILKEEKRMKKKRKRSSSSSTSSSSSARSSSSSSGHRKSKKRKRKRRRSSRGSKRQRRLSSRDEEEEDEEEWYPAPANTSASFLGRGAGGGAGGEYTGADVTEWDRESYSQKQAPRSLSPSPHRSDSPGSSPQAADRQRDGSEVEGRPSGSGRPGGGGGGSSRRERSKERNGGEREASRGLGSPRHRKLSSTSSVGSEYSRKSELPSQSQTSSRRSEGSNQDSFASRRSDGGKESDLSRRSDSGRHEVGARSSKKEDIKAARKSEGDNQFPSNTSRNGRGSSDGGDKKALPANLLDIFSQIAQFEKEKGGKQNK